MSFQTDLDAHDAQILSTFNDARNGAPVSTSAATSWAPNPITSSLTQEQNRPTRPYLDVPTGSSYRPRLSIDSTYSELSELSIYSDELQRSRAQVSIGALRPQSASLTTTRRGWRGTLGALWIRNKGAILVLLAQAFGSLMNVATRILETEGAHGRAMHPFQVQYTYLTFENTKCSSR
jgi:hypothetical protein